MCEYIEILARFTMRKGSIADGKDDTKHVIEHYYIEGLAPSGDRTASAAGCPTCVQLTNV